MTKYNHKEIINNIIIDLEKKRLGNSKKMGR